MNDQENDGKICKQNRIFLLNLSLFEICDAICLHNLINIKTLWHGNSANEKILIIYINFQFSFVLFYK